MVDELASRLAEIRAECQKANRFSWTTEKFQADLISFIVANRDRGAGVIEVGCFRGGLSCLLAEICRRFGWPFYTMDVDPAATASARAMLAQFGLDHRSTVFDGSLATFAAQTRLAAAPVLIILDGDHRYEAVIDDIHWTYRLNARPYAAAFHDYSLRHPSSGEAVDQAIRDAFGPALPVTFIGAAMRRRAVPDRREARGGRSLLARPRLGGRDRRSAGLPEIGRDPRLKRFCARGLTPLTLPNIAIDR